MNSDNQEQPQAEAKKPRKVLVVGASDCIGIARFFNEAGIEAECIALTPGYSEIPMPDALPGLSLTRFNQNKRSPHGPCARAGKKKGKIGSADRWR